MSKSPPPPSLHWAYFLDVDGTLIEYAPTPDSILVDTELLRLITTLHRACAGAVALVSGRSLTDLNARLGMAAIPMAGLHGLEWQLTAGKIHRHPAVRDLHAIEKALGDLQQRHDNLVIEHKGNTIALHYRNAPRLGSYLHRWVRRLVERSDLGLHIQPGKRVIEIKPAGRDKGNAIETFMTLPPFAGRKPVFVGDDLTDEHGFAMVNRVGGTSIKVGRGKSIATYRLRNVVAVRDWLSLALVNCSINDEEKKLEVT